MVSGSEDAKGDTFRVMLRMDINEGMEAEFEKMWRAVGDSVTSHPGNLGQWLSRSAEGDRSYYIVSDWVNEELFREFERSAGHVTHRQMLHPYRSSGSMTTMHVVAYLSGEAIF